MIALPAAAKAADSTSSTALAVHDLRNLMATIQAGSELLMRSGIPDPGLVRLARNVHGASLRMHEAMEQFLEILRCAGHSPDDRRPQTEAT